MNPLFFKLPFFETSFVWGGFDEKILFSVFILVSGKLGVNSSDNLLKSTSLGGGFNLFH
ncbi:hypothetical protein HPHPA4_1127 [Helicobacter pylori Hp A-4]|nr:hypothetical protein HPHPA4_1127 [Helicobacter pylori Hp A-4]